MKTVGILFIGLVCLLLYKQAQASTGINHISFCAGYSLQMSYVKKKKVYAKMQKYFDSQIPNGTLEKNQIISEYYQSGVDTATNNSTSPLAIKCEEDYKVSK